jgi:NAD+ synthase (glutamine-hydrolysing)
MRILLAQINPTIGDIQGNSEKVFEGISQGRERNADLVLFPELALSGYPPEDFLILPHYVDDLAAALNPIAAATKGIAAVVGVARRNPTIAGKPLCNSAAIFEDGKFLGFQDKMLLPTYDVFDERRFFEPGQHLHLWDICGRKIAVTICEDIWQHSEVLLYASYDRDPILELSWQSPELALNLSSSPFSPGKANVRIDVCARAARTLKCPLVFCNQVGGNDSLIFDGHSLYVDSKGELLDIAKGFEEDFLLVDLSKHMDPITPAFNPMEDIRKALILGLRDYFHKSGFKKACLGLSGGVDSALVAYLAVEALGKDNVLGILMPSRYSSEGSITDALQLAHKLGISCTELSIEGPFQSYLELMAPFFAGKASDSTEENIQARIRGMIQMAFSNKLGYIVLSTGNKSELAMGYSTLYGDMCGGLAVISDVTKQQVYALARWINRNEEIIPWNTIRKPPSAELRPNQKDTDTLPDYEIVDNVLQAYIEEHQTPDKIAARFGYSPALVNDLVRRIHRNEYKRRQSPPGLRISEKAFSVGRRFPIVQKYVK